jgi:Protein of unknown function (DUF2889)
MRQRVRRARGVHRNAKPVLRSGFTWPPAHVLCRCCDAISGRSPRPPSPPGVREHLHTRAIKIDFYRRTDGLYDIEAHLTDTRLFGQANFDRGHIPAGEPIHDMRLRLSVNEMMHIVGCETVSDLTPYAMYPPAAPNFSVLIGLRISAGFLRKANHRVGGAAGCTHLRELLQQMATAALQTINPARVRRDMAAEGASDQPGSDRTDTRIAETMGGPRNILNTCLANAADGPPVKRGWPHRSIGTDRDAEESAAADWRGFDHGPASLLPREMRARAAIGAVGTGDQAIRARAAPERLPRPARPVSSPRSREAVCGWFPCLTPGVRSGAASWAS